MGFSRRLCLPASGIPNGSWRMLRDRQVTSRATCTISNPQSRIANMNQAIDNRIDKRIVPIGYALFAAWPCVP